MRITASLAEREGAVVGLESHLHVGRSAATPFCPGGLERSAS